MKETLFKSVVAFMSFFLFTLAWCTQATSSSKASLPDPFVMTSISIGTTAYTVMEAYAEGVSKLTGKTVRVLPTSTDAGRFVPLLQGKAQVNASSPGSAYSAIMGVGKTFKDWGPQRLRAVWHMYVLSAGIAARGDNDDINTPADFKGAKVGVAAGIESSYLMTRSALAFFGYTLQDVKLVEISGGWGNAYRCLPERKCDLFNLPVGSPTTLELAATCGIKWFEQPPDDVEGWKRHHEHAPYQIPILFSRGSGTSPENPKWMVGNPWGLYCYDTLDDDTVYAIVKAFHEAYPHYKDAHFLCVDSTLENTLGIDWSFAPYHNGAIRYFKEMGKWNQQNQERQQELLQAEKERITKYEARGRAK